MRIVIKVGTSTLAHAGGHLNIRRVELLCKIMSDLKNAGHELLLVTSGAIGMGVGKLGLPGRPADMPGKQACAAVGQCELMYVYDKLFSEYNHNVAQLLLTAEDIKDPRRSRLVHDNLQRLLEFRVLPIINENDAVADRLHYVEGDVCKGRNKAAVKKCLENVVAARVNDNGGSEGNEVSHTYRFATFCSEAERGESLEYKGGKGILRESADNVGKSRTDSSRRECIRAGQKGGGNEYKAVSQMNITHHGEGEL